MGKCLGYEGGAGALNAAVHVAQAHVFEGLHAVVHRLRPHLGCRIQGQPKMT